MESPALLVFAGFFLFGSNHHTPVTWIFFSLWVLHYVNRTLNFPVPPKDQREKNACVDRLHGPWVQLRQWVYQWILSGVGGTGYTLIWLADPRFIGGIIVFLAGMYINWQADNILIHLRKPGETGYVIPKGGFFRYVSCPNHFGEIVEWFGFALDDLELPCPIVCHLDPCQCVTPCAASPQMV